MKTTLTPEDNVQLSRLSETVIHNFFSMYLFKDFFLFHQSEPDGNLTSWSNRCLKTQNEYKTNSAKLIYYQSNKITAWHV